MTDTQIFSNEYLNRKFLFIPAPQQNFHSGFQRVIHTIEFLTAAIQKNCRGPFESNILLCVTSNFFPPRNHNFFYTPHSLPNRKPALPVILIGEEPCFPGHWLESWRQDIHEGPGWGIYISVQSFPLHLPACQVSELLCQRGDNGCCSAPCLLHTQCFWPSWETSQSIPIWGIPLLFKTLSHSEPPVWNTTLFMTLDEATPKYQISNFFPPLKTYWICREEK